MVPRLAAIVWKVPGSVSAMHCGSKPHPSSAINRSLFPSSIVMSSRREWLWMKPVMNSIWVPV